MSQNFKAALEEQLEVAGITAYRLSQMAGLTRATMSRLLAGERSAPSWETVVRICKALGVSADVFVTDDIVIPEPKEPGKPGRPKAELEPEPAPVVQPKRRKKGSS